VNDQRTSYTAELTGFHTIFVPGKAVLSLISLTQASSVGKAILAVVPRLVKVMLRTVSLVPPSPSGIVMARPTRTLFKVRVAGAATTGVPNPAIPPVTMFTYCCVPVGAVGVVGAWPLVNHA